MEALATTGHLFALLIGIDTYKSEKINRLRGAVADADAFKTYLQDYLNVPEDHITILKNQLATRTAILQELQRLANNPDIGRGDPIIIFYAGHGSEAAAPPEWEAGGSNIQLTLPYDVDWESGDEVFAAIPDRTLGALIEAIAQEKDNNIVVIMDSCHSASGTRTSKDSADGVRSSRPPLDFQLSGNLDHDILSSPPLYGGLRSHVLLSACGSSGQAWESHDRESNDHRGVFTVALLEFLKEKHQQLNKLRYYDVVMQMDIDPKQNPHCEGFYQERYIFTTAAPSPIECFIPVYMRRWMNGPHAYVLNGGSAHGLVVGDEFGVHMDEEEDEANGILVVDEVGPFYSVVRPSEGTLFPSNVIAKRAKKDKRQPLRLFTRPGDTISKILLSLLRDRPQDFSNFDINGTSDDCKINISTQDDRVIFRLKDMTNTQAFDIEPTTEELARVLKASSKFFSELDHTADFPDMTQDIQVEIFTLQRSQFRFSGAPTNEFLPQGAVRPVPNQSNSYTLQQGSSYGLKLSNNSKYDLYPTVQYFDPSNEFNFDTLYRPPSSRSNMDVPLKKGGTLTIGYGSGGSPPLIGNREGLGYLKILLSAWPLDPFYDENIKKPFRLAPCVPESLEGPWATIIKMIIYSSSETGSPLLDSQESYEEFTIRKPTEPSTKPYSLRTMGHYHGNNKSVSLSIPESPTSVDQGLEHLSATDVDPTFPGLSARVHNEQLDALVSQDEHAHLHQTRSTRTQRATEQGQKDTDMYGLAWPPPQPPFPCEDAAPPPTSL